MKKVTKMTLTGLAALDPVSVFFEDCGPGQGKLTVEYFGKALSYQWSAMGDGRDLKTFLLGTNIDYIVNKLKPFGMDRTVIDFGQVSKDIGRDVDEATIRSEKDRLIERYGEDWQYSLPTKVNHQYEYLCRIVEAVKEGIVNEHHMSQRDQDIEDKRQVVDQADDLYRATVMPARTPAP